MQISQNATVVVADGGKLNLFQNTDTQGGVTLKALPAAELHAESGGSGGHHHDSSANPSHGQGAEDDFAASVASFLDKKVEAGEIRHLVLIAAPRTLGELRKHLSKQTLATVAGEIAKDLTGHSGKEVEKAILSA